MTIEEYEWILSQDLDGEQDASRLVEAARPADSPGHGLFDWDVKKAAEAHWLDVARGHIRFVKVRYTPGEKRVTRLNRVDYVKNPLNAFHDSGYIRLSVINNTPAGEVALREELKRVASFVKRARDVASQLGLVAECEAGLKDIMKRPVRTKAG